MEISDSIKRALESLFLDPSKFTSENLTMEGGQTIEDMRQAQRFGPAGFSDDMAKNLGMDRPRYGGPENASLPISGMMPDLLQGQPAQPSGAGANMGYPTVSATAPTMIDELRALVSGTPYDPVHVAATEPVKPETPATAAPASVTSGWWGSGSFSGSDYGRGGGLDR